MSELVRRQQAVAATLARYRGKSFDWQGARTCVHLARFHMRQMGHKPERIPPFRSERGALRALAARGWKTVADLLDAQPGLCRIAPAMMLPGDLAVLEGAEGVGTVTLCVTAHKLAGWREDVDDMVLLDVTLGDVQAAWRV